MAQFFIVVRPQKDATMEVGANGSEMKIGCSVNLTHGGCGVRPVVAPTSGAIERVSPISISEDDASGQTMFIARCTKCGGSTKGVAAQDFKTALYRTLVWGTQTEAAGSELAFQPVCFEGNILE